MGLQVSVRRSSLSSNDSVSFIKQAPLRTVYFPRPISCGPFAPRYSFRASPVGTSYVGISSAIAVTRAATRASPNARPASGAAVWCVAGWFAEASAKSVFISAAIGASNAGVEAVCLGSMISVAPCFAWSTRGDAAPAPAKLPLACSICPPSDCAEELTTCWA